MIRSEKSPYKPFAEQINKNSVNGLIAINQLAGKIFAEDADYLSARTILGTSSGAIESTIKAVTQHSFPPEKTVEPDV